MKIFDICISILRLCRKQCCKLIFDSFYYSYFLLLIGKYHEMDRDRDNAHRAPRHWPWWKYVVVLRGVRTVYLAKSGLDQTDILHCNCDRDRAQRTPLKWKYHRVLGYGANIPKFSLKKIISIIYWEISRNITIVLEAHTKEWRSLRTLYFKYYILPLYSF